MDPPPNGRAVSHQASAIRRQPSGVSHQARGLPMTGTAGGNEWVSSPAGKRVLVVALLCVLAFCNGPSSTAQGPGRRVVADVVVVGNRNVTTEQIMRLIKTRPGGDFTTGQLQQDVTSLVGTRMFRDVKVRDQDSPQGVIVTFEVKEYPNLIREIVFKNAHHVSQTDLDNMTGLRKGMPLDPTKAQQACFEIQDYLKKKGRYFANVTLEEGGRVGDSRVVFNITEGPVVRIRAIDFTGNTFVNGPRLKTQIDSGKAILGLLGGTFIPAMVDNDAIKLEEYYKSNGYLDVRVTREMSFTPDYQYVDIVFHVHEGLRYTVKDVQIDGVKELKPAQVGSVVQVEKGKFYNEAKVASDMRYITDYYGWRGYPVVVQKDLYVV